MKILDHINNLLEKNISFVLATVVDADGGSPAKAGFKMVIADDGSLFGSVGGGGIEYKAVDVAKECIKRGRSCFKEFELADLGMACGGRAAIFFEYLAKQEHLYVLGAGHICQAITPIAESLGYKVVVIDDRKEVTDPKMHPSAAEVICGDFEETIGKIKIATPASALIVTNKHLHDYDCLKAVLLRKEEFAYIGMIGSVVKVEKIFERALDEGLSKEKIKRVYSPVGLKIGGDTPAEIAVGIMAEMIAIKYEKDLPHMKIDLSNNEKFA